MTLTMEKISRGVEQSGKQFPIKRVGLFGSYANGNFTDESDVDLLVEFQSPAVSLLTLSGLRIFLENFWGKSVDIVHAPIPAGSILEIGKVVPLYES